MRIFFKIRFFYNHITGHFLFRLASAHHKLQRPDREAQQGSGAATDTQQHSDSQTGHVGDIQAQCGEASSMVEVKCFIMYLLRIIKDDSLKVKS